jgi:hypothetical protein
MESTAAAQPTVSHWAETEYWRQSRRPLASLIFILPALAIYEGGLLLLGPRAMRNGADVWLRELLERFGLGQYFFLPLLTAALLLAWHHTTRDRWQLLPGVLGGMLIECALFGLLLVTLGRLQGALLQSLLAAAIGMVTLQWEGAKSWSPASRVVGFLGAGIYEELAFRLALLPVVAGAWQLAGGSQRLRLFVAIGLTSLAFSAAHYVGPHGEALEAYSFLFRFFAGNFFGVLFVYRGFGIAAGTHALYDIFVGLC